MGDSGNETTGEVPSEAARMEAPAPDPQGEPEESPEGAAGPAGSSTPEVERSLQRIESAISQGLSQLLAEFQTKLTYDASKQAQVDRLHAELEAYKSDLVAKAVKPLLLGLVRLHDDVGKVLAALRGKPEAELTGALLLRHLAEVQDDVELLLGQHGVERFEGSGEAFDPRRQTALRTVPTDDPALAGRLAGRLRAGFEMGEVLLQKERVAVYAVDGGTKSSGGKE